MPSTLVHVAVAGLLAAALLGDSFDRGSVLLVLAATALVDADAFLELAVQGAHRAAFHTYLLPLAIGTVAYYDLAVREDGWLRRWRADAARVVAVTVAAVAVAGIGLDMVTNGVNVFYPLHDQFYTVDGKALLSDQRGFVQTFVELDPPEQESKQVRTTKNTQYSTGVDPAPSKARTPKDVERKFGLVRNGRQLLLVVAGYGTVVSRLWEQSERGLRSRWF